MRLNQFVAKATGMSRRRADMAIKQGKVEVDGKPAKLGMQLADNSEIKLDGLIVSSPKTTTIILNKPVGYVCSRDGQGSKTIYDILPKELSSLKPVGRLDKDSSGLLLVTNDGHLAQGLTHPSHKKDKTYEVILDQTLQPSDQQKIENGIELHDGLSKLRLSGHGKAWVITMHEGRNRQIRRTFEKLGYKVTKLHRTRFGNYKLGNLQTKKVKILT